MTPGRRILLGRVAGAFGVRGELKVVSWTEPRDALFRYQPWILRAGAAEREVEGARGRETAKGIVARIPGVETRDDAEAMTGTEIWVPRERLRSRLPASTTGSISRGWPSSRSTACRSAPSRTCSRPAPIR